MRNLLDLAFVFLFTALDSVFYHLASFEVLGFWLVTRHSVKEITPTPCGSNIPTVKPQNALFSILSYYLSLPPIYNQKMSSQSAYLSPGRKAPHATS